MGIDPGYIFVAIAVVVLIGYVTTVISDRRAERHKREQPPR